MADQIIVGDRRFELRVPKDQDVEIRWTEPGGPDLRGTARLRDLSISGARLEFDRPIRVKTVLAFDYGDRHLTANVRYCARHRNAYILGVEFA